MEHALDEKDIERDGLTLHAAIYYDADHGEPWNECDGHGEVSDWTTRDKLPGERILCQDGRSKRFYDYAEAIEVAKRDGWDAEPYGTGTKGEQAVRAVDRDFAYLSGWCASEWHYVGVEVTLGKWVGSLWGVENNSAEYLREVTDELAREVLAMRSAEIAHKASHL